MTFGDKMRELVEQGMNVSKDLVSKAGAKAQDLGEKGVLKFEIMQLEGQAQKLMARLGTEVYSTFADGTADAVSREDAVIKGLLAEIAVVRDSIEKREAELKNSSANS